jgi:hypothetical protein
VSAEGCFLVRITKSSMSKLGYIVQLRFSVTQHSRDEKLLKSLVFPPLVPRPEGRAGGLKLSVPPNPHPTHVWGGGWEKGKNVALLSPPLVKRKGGGERPLSI